jgi:hypothetical protein
VWVMHTGPYTSGQCTVSVYVPTPPANAAYTVDEDGAHALYDVYDPTADPNDANPTGSFTIDQAQDVGQWVTVATPFPVNDNRIGVRLHDRGIDYNSSPASQFAVGMVQVSCT